jgi:hypothetical protein
LLLLLGAFPCSGELQIEYEIQIEIHDSGMWGRFTQIRTQNTSAHEEAAAAAVAVQE